MSTIAYWLDKIKNPRIVKGVPQTGTPLWELTKLIEGGAKFPDEEIDFIVDLCCNGHYEQKWAANHLLNEIEEGFDDSD